MNGWPPLDLLIPHGPEARCVDSIVEFTAGKRLLANLQVRPSLVLYNAARSGIPAWAGIEIMAQAAGLYVGLNSRRAEGEPAPLGYLVGVRRFHTTCETFTAGEQLTVEAVCVNAAARGLGHFECRILKDGQTLTGAILSVLRSPRKQGG